MALTTCPDCQKKISDAAPSCPNCGRPMSAPRQASVRAAAGAADVQVIEATSKKYKGIQLAGVVLICLGVVTCSVAFMGENKNPSPGFATFNGLIWTAGIVLYMWGRIAAWWHHR